SPRQATCAGRARAHPHGRTAGNRERDLLSHPHGLSTAGAAAGVGSADPHPFLFFSPPLLVPPPRALPQQPPLIPPPPGQVDVNPPHVAVRRQPAVEPFPPGGREEPQVKLLEDAGEAELEMPAEERGDLLVRDRAGAEGLHLNTHRM